MERLAFQVVLISLVMAAVLGQLDQTRQERATGPEVVESVVEQVRTSCVLPQDNMFLRRLAYVESHDGTDPNTFRAGFYGGIWQVTQSMYDQTKSSSYLASLRNDIQTHLNINWMATSYTDLLKPLYSGLAAALYLSQRLQTNPSPTTISEQQTFWANQYHAEGARESQYSELINLLTSGCQSQGNLDLAFIVDTSSSISPADFEAAKQFIIDTLSVFDIDARRTRVSLITYATLATIRFNWDSYSTRSTLDSAIRSLNYESGGTETALALNKAREELFSRARSNAVKVLVLITDGQSHDKIDTNHAATLIHNSGDILVLVVGVGNDVDQDELHNIASNPSCKHTFTIRSYDQISALREEIQQMTCRAPLILNVNQTVSCPMCHCSPYAVPMPVSDKVIIEATTSCSSPVTLYTSYNDGYPTRYGALASLTFNRTSYNSLHVAAPSSSNRYYYVNVEQPNTGVCSSGCTVTLHAFMADVRVVCIESGVQRTCTQEDIRLYAPYLLP